MVKDGEDFLVYDAKTGDDITRSVLAQIIFEQENKAGQNLLPTTFLRQLIRFYGDSMQMVVPKYLEQSIDTLTREQEKFRKQLTNTFCGNAVRAAGRTCPPQHGIVSADLLDVQAVRAAARRAPQPSREGAGAGAGRRQYRRPAPSDEGHAGAARADVERAEEGRAEKASRSSLSCLHGNLRASSPRTRGPITTNRCCCGKASTASPDRWAAAYGSPRSRGRRSCCTGAGQVLARRRQHRRAPIPRPLR